MCVSLGTPQESVLCLGWHVLYRMAIEPEHRKLLWMQTRTEVKLSRAVNMTVQHFWHHVSLHQAATGRWPETQTVNG